MNDQCIQTFYNDLKAASCIKLHVCASWENSPLIGCYSNIETTASLSTVLKLIASLIYCYVLHLNQQRLSLVLTLLEATAFLIGCYSRFEQTASLNDPVNPMTSLNGTLHFRYNFIKLGWILFPSNLINCLIYRARSVHLEFPKIFGLKLNGSARSSLKALKKRVQLSRLTRHFSQLDRSAYKMHRSI